MLTHTDKRRHRGAAEAVVGLGGSEDKTRRCSSEHVRCPLEWLPATVPHIHHVEIAGLSVSSEAHTGLGIKRRASRQQGLRTRAVAWMKTSGRVNS